MSLHVDSYEYTGTESSATPLLLIHGWAMHGGMWRNVAEQLSQHFQVLAVDLPGHGGSAVSAQTDLDTMVDTLSAQFGEPLNICGWSMGGQVALRWAMRHPHQVKSLMLVASTPSFVCRDGWNHAMSLELLLEFGAALQQHYAFTLKRFLALQVQGADQERELLAVFRDILFNRGEPDLNALLGGLEILRTCDLRSALPFITQPALIVAGERDALAPMQVSEYMAQHMPFAELVRIEGAAHAPFLSHADEFIKHLVKFMSERSK